MKPIGWAATALLVLHPTSSSAGGPAPGASAASPSAQVASPAPVEAGEVADSGRFLTVKMPWDRDAEATINGLLSQCERTLADVQARPEEATFESTFLAWDRMCGHIDEIGSFASWDFNTSTDKAVRDRGEKTEELVSKISARLYTLRFPYEIFKKTYEKLGKGLTWDRASYSKDLLRSFENNGVHLEGETKARVKAIDHEIIEIGTRFAKVLKDREVELSLTEVQARPIDPSMVRTDAKTGKRGLLLREDSYWEVLRRHPDASFRESVYRKYYEGTADQSAELDLLRKLRREKAGLVKGVSYATLELEDEGFTQDQVRQTLSELKGRTERWYEKTLADYTRLNGGRSPRIWDLAFLEETAPSEGVKPEVLLEYFSATNVVKMLLELSRDLYGLQFRRIRYAEPSRVEEYSVADRSGQVIGSVTLDLFPRPNKYSHAACWTMRGRATHYPERRAALGLAANLRERSLSGGGKGILFDEVQTLFHEFGHVLHGLLIDAEPIGAHGVPRSLVEVPSQVFETWALDPAVLDRMALHWKTGQPLPAELRKVLYRKSQRFAARHLRTQCLYALFDLDFHEKTGGSIQELWDSMTDELFGKGFYPKKVPWFTRFGHLDGYGAKYWGYKFADLGKSQVYWSLVHRFRSMVTTEIGKLLEEKLLRFGGLKKLPEVAPSITGSPLTPLPYILETLMDYPALRASIEAQAKAGKEYAGALEATFDALMSQARSPVSLKRPRKTTRRSRRAGGGRPIKE